MSKIILDTNIYVSGMIFGGKVGTVLYHVIENEDLYVSDQLIEELYRIFINKFGVSAKILKELATVLNGIETIHPEIKISICRDPKDNFILELAQHVGADFIITGDKDLLTLKKWHKTIIIDPFTYIRTM